MIKQREKMMSISAQYRTPMAQEDAFKKWMEEVNRCLNFICGMGADDIPDYDYWNAWNDGRKPETVARAARKAASFY